MLSLTLFSYFRGVSNKFIRWNSSCSPNDCRELYFFPLNRFLNVNSIRLKELLLKMFSLSTQFLSIWTVPDVKLEFPLIFITPYLEDETSEIPLDKYSVNSSQSFWPYSYDGSSFGLWSWPIQPVFLPFLTILVCVLRPPLLINVTELKLRCFWWPGAKSWALVHGWLLLHTSLRW